MLIMFSTLIEKLVLRDEPIDIDRVKKACQYAERIHRHQSRKTGEPFIMHPIAVAEIIEEIGGDEDMIIASILHDTVEDGRDPAKIEKYIREYNMNIPIPLNFVHSKK